MEYFDVPEANPGQDGVCSDNQCPCGFPGARIPRGTGYIYISQECVDFRRDARSVAEAEMKIAMIRARMGGMVMFDPSMITSILVCEQGARARGLDLATAAADARHWWLTHKVPLRATPLAGRGALDQSEEPDAPKEPAVFTREIRAEAASLEEATAALEAQLKAGETIISRKTVTNGDPRSVRGKADTLKGAFAQARQRVPKGASGIVERELSAGGREAFSIVVEAFSEEEAKEAAKREGKRRACKGKARLESVKLLEAGKKGFLGIGRKPSRYEASMSDYWPAEVEISFTPPITLSAKVKIGS